MPVLSDSRRERFAQGLAQGLTQLEAYSSAGYKSHAGNASALAANQIIIERVAEIQHRIEIITSAATAEANKEFCDRYAITKERILLELAKIGFANMLDYITVGSDGLPYVDFSNVDRDKGVAIKEVHCEIATVSEVGPDGERVPVQVRKARFTLADKRTALVDLGRHLNLFKEDNASKNVQDTRPAAEQRAELLEELAALGIHIVPPAEEEPQGVANRPGTTH